MWGAVGFAVFVVVLALVILSIKRKAKPEPNENPGVKKSGQHVAFIAPDDDDSTGRELFHFAAKHHECPDGAAGCMKQEKQDDGRQRYVCKECGGSIHFVRVAAERFEKVVRRA